MVSTLNILGLFGLILAIVNAFLGKKIRSDYHIPKTWVLCIVIAYVLLLPVTVFNDLQKQIPDGWYSVPCKVTVEETGYDTDQARAIIGVDSFGRWLSDLKGIADSGLQYVENASSPLIEYSQTVIDATLRDSSGHSYDAQVQVPPISASTLGVTLPESFAAAGLFEKAFYLVMLLIALTNAVSIFIRCRYNYRKRIKQ
ncbi:MAG: hypothetical protein IKW92_05430 [Firmicutes bacterium]|nr:hypothetical protein [Bacillota bacterium]